MEKNLYRITKSILPAIIFLLCLHKQIGIAELSMYHCGLALVIVVGLTAFCHVKLKGRLFMGLSVMVCPVVIWFVFGREKVMLFWESYFVGLMGQTVEEMPWGILQESVQVLWISMIAFLLQLLMERLFFLKVLLAGGLLGVLFWDLFSARSLLHISVVCILLYVVMVFVEWTEKYWEKRKKNQGTQYVVWLLPFFVLYFLLMLIMPAPEKPYDWKFVRQAYTRMRENFIVFSQNVLEGNREGFHTGFSGFSGEGKLLGNLLDDDKELIYVQGEMNLKTNVYLTGKVYDTFTGTRWLQESESMVCDRMLDTYETAYAVALYDEEFARNYMQSASLNLTYKYLNTGYLFTPLKTFGFGRGVSYSSEGGNLLWDKKKGYGTEYAVNFFQLNVNHELFYEFLEAEREQDAAVWEKVQRMYIEKSQERYTLEDLAAHREEIYRIYGQKPLLSTELETYLAELVEDCETTVEKLRTIESMLGAMTYNRSPGVFPETVVTEGDFLDYFLFQSREGFCSYFATTFVLLARAEGIPARYVEGFCVPVQNQGAIVYSGMAHAWPEVYIDGVGWIPFEPTPGYSVLRYTPWAMESRDKYQAADYGDSSEEEEEEESMDIVEVVLEAEEEPFDRSVLWVILYTVLFIGMVGGAIYAVDSYLARRRYAKLSMKKKMLTQLQRNVRLLAMLGYPRNDWETLEELEQKAWAIVHCESEEQTKKLQFLNVYEEVLYGNYAVTEEMLQEVLEERRYLLELLKKWKPLAYFYCKISGRFVD